MALTDRLGKSKTIAEIKSALLNPALTSHFDVEIPLFSLDSPHEKNIPN